jgi:hypothetical protein
VLHMKSVFRVSLRLFYTYTHDISADIFICKLSAIVRFQLKIAVYIFMNVPNIRFHENPCSIARFVTWVILSGKKVKLSL